MSFHKQFDEIQWKLLQARAQRVSRSINEQDARRFKDALLVRLHDEHYALPVDEVLAVHEDIPVMPLPGTPPSIAGIANVRGHLVTVLDLANILGVPDTGVATNPVLVVVENGEAHTAFVVDQVSDVSAISEDALAPVPNHDLQHVQDFHRGVLEDGTVLLSMRTILNDPALIVEQE